MEEENYEDFVWVADIEDEVLKERLLKEGFKKVPLRSIMPYFGDNGIIAYRIDERKLTEKMKKIMLERIAERNNTSVEEAEKMLNKKGWFIRANGAGTKNIYKYIG
jgi:hypothetical protein